MPVKIRLMRIGAKKRPYYRVVAVDERKKRTGGYLDLLGTYNPLTEPKEIILKQDKIDAWIKKGAVLSDGYLRMTKQAPQRPPRKPKKEKEEAVRKEPVKEPEAIVEEKVEEVKEESGVEVVTETETPVEETSTEASEKIEEKPIEEGEGGDEQTIAETDKSEEA